MDPIPGNNYFKTDGIFLERVNAFLLNGIIYFFYAGD